MESHENIVALLYENDLLKTNIYIYCPLLAGLTGEISCNVFPFTSFSHPFIPFININLPQICVENILKVNMCKKNMSVYTFQN